MSTNAYLIGRRNFLKVSAAAVTTVAVAPRLFASEPVDVSRLAVGYAGADDGPLMPAASIPAGDGAFIGRGGRLSLSGASGVPADPAARRAVELLVYFRYWEGGERREAPYLAWGASRLNGGQGNPVSFPVPVDEDQQIRLSVHVEQGTRQTGAPVSRRRAAVGRTLEGQHLPVDLTLLSGDGIKLTRGFYVIVPLFAGDREPYWSAYHLQQAGGRWALHDAGGTPAAFEHFVMRMDYARS